MGLLDNKIAVVTGGGRGIGFGICAAYVREGAKVVITDVDYESAKAAAEKLGKGSKAVKLNVADKKEVVSTVDYIWENIGPIDIWVNNAGINEIKPIEDITEEGWDKILNVNLKGVFFCCQAVLKKMKERRSGKFVNIASMGGERGGRYAGIHYSASKGGELALTKVLAANGGEYGITANAITPGYIMTPMGEEVFSGDKQRYISQIPLGRMGTPEDVANAAVFLGSYLSDYITGDTLRVNGGVYI